MDSAIERKRATTGLILLAIGAVAFVALFGRQELGTTDVGRLLIIFALCWLVAKGHHWASVLLGLFAIIGALAMLMACLRLGASLLGFAFFVGALLYGGGYILFWRAGGSALFKARSDG